MRNTNRLTGPGDNFFRQYRATIGFWLLALVAFLWFLFANFQDFQDELLEQQQYCLDVEEGYAPDYKHIYNEVCK